MYYLAKISIIMKKRKSSSGKQPGLQGMTKLCASGGAELRGLHPGRKLLIHTCHSVDYIDYIY